MQGGGLHSGPSPNAPSGVRLSWPATPEASQGGPVTPRLDGRGPPHAMTQDDLWVVPMTTGHQSPQPPRRP